MPIRKLEKSDIPGALELIWKVFGEFEAPEYSEEGIREFKDFVELSAIEARIDSGEMEFWAYHAGEQLLGVIATRNVDHISMLFVDKEFQRQGIAKALLQIVLTECREHHKKRITVNSSPYAVEIYRKMDFVALDSEQMQNGIRFTPMVYLLG